MFYRSPRHRSSAPAFLRPRAAETIRGLTCLIQQAKNLFHPRRLGIYQEVLAHVFCDKFGMAPAEVWENLNPPAGIQVGDNGLNQTMNSWHKRDWKQFYELARRPWQRHRPPRPVYPSGFNRVSPAAGFSLSELDDAGVDLDMAERLGLPVDGGGIGATRPDVHVPRDLLRSSPQPLTFR